MSADVLPTPQSRFSPREWIAIAALFLSSAGAIVGGWISLRVDVASLGARFEARIDGLQRDVDNLTRKVDR